MFWIFLIILWFATGAVSAGYIYAYFQDKWPDIAGMDKGKDQATAWFAFAVGPAAAVATALFLLTEGKTYGWRKWW